VKTALIIVDVQRDFIDGTLGAPGRGNVVPALTRLADNAEFVVSSLDWHPANHSSFSEHPTFTDGSWPVHCVKGTHGADIDPTLARRSDEFVFKGTDQDREAYSAFEGLTGRGESLGALLVGHRIDRVVIGGLCTDYCVLATALDAVKLGYDVTVATDACAGVAPDTTTAAWQQMADAGVHLI
jgi:nicotinamidase/pyrazinamidase